MRLQREATLDSSTARGERAPGKAAAPGRMQKGLRIALLSYRSAPHCGGQGVYVRHLSRALRDRGHRVDVISGEPYPELDPGVGLVPLPGMNCYGYPRFRDALFDRGIRSLRNLREWLEVVSGGFPEPRLFGERARQYLLSRLEQYDLVHDNQSLCYGLLELRQKGLPVVSTIHHPITQDLRYALKKERRWRVRLLIRRWHSFLGMQKRVAKELERIVTVSSASREDIAEDFGVDPERIEVVPNGVDTEVFRPYPEIEARSFKIMATASADVPLKGLDYLIKAVHLLSREFPEVELRVLGRPRENGTTQELIRQLGMQDRISFFSGVSQEGIAREYASSAVAVVPSLYEGFGLPAVEAMACGKPLVATTGGALPEIVGRAGELVPPADAGALAEAIGDLLRQPERAAALGQSARDRVEKRFTWDSAAQDTERIYMQMAGLAVGGRQDSREHRV